MSKTETTQFFPAFGGWGTKLINFAGDVVKRGKAALDGWLPSPAGRTVNDGTFRVYNYNPAAWKTRDDGIPGATWRDGMPFVEILAIPALVAAGVVIYLMARK